LTVTLPRWKLWDAKSWHRPTNVLRNGLTCNGNSQKTRPATSSENSIQTRHNLLCRFFPSVQRVSLQCACREVARLTEQVTASKNRLMAIDQFV
jgi:hypothetical protein